MSIQIPSKTVRFTDEDDNTILEGPPLDILFIASAEIVDPDMPIRDRYEKAAEAVNREYNSNLTFAQILFIIDTLQEQLEVAKKNSTQSLESVIGMELMASD